MSRKTKHKASESRDHDSGSDKKDVGEGFEKSTLREYFESICVAVILALFIRTFVFQAFKIPTGSMENNLLIGDHLIVNKMLYSPAPSELESALARSVTFSVKTSSCSNSRTIPSGISSNG